MKSFLSPLLVCLVTFNIACAQSTLLLNKRWQVKELNTIFLNKSINLYHKDSTTNLFDFSNLEYEFLADGSYKKYVSQSNPYVGSWSVKSISDSAVIDNTPFRITKLTIDSFFTRGYSLEVADTSGRMDTAYTYFKMYRVSSVALPVELASFAGKYFQNQVQLEWSILTQINLSRFDIEAGYDGITFSKIGSVPNLGIAGSSKYTFSDVSFFKTGKNYYRLKQIDLDGSYRFSAVIVVSVNGQSQSSVSIYPNPAADKIIVGLSKPMGNTLQVQLTDIAGRQVWSKALAGNSNGISVSLPKLTKGMYVVTIINDKGEKLFADKLMIQ